MRTSTTTRTLAEIKRELDEASNRRAELWQELSLAADSEKSAEVAQLNEQITALWAEARAVRNRLRFGAHEAIIKRARAEERLERDLAKVA